MICHTKCIKKASNTAISIGFDLANSQIVFCQLGTLELKRFCVNGLSYGQTLPMPHNVEVVADAVALTKDGAKARGRNEFPSLRLQVILNTMIEKGVQFSTQSSLRPSKYMLLVVCCLAHIFDGTVT
jgi:hypothetical protein